MLGYHVLSTLIWGIHESPSSTQIPTKTSKKNFFVSRMGSGSHLMAQVLAAREGWPVDSLNFQIIDNLDGALAAYAQGEEGYFLWENTPQAQLWSKECLFVPVSSPALGLVLSGWLPHRQSKLGENTYLKFVIQSMPSRIC